MSGRLILHANQHKACFTCKLLFVRAQLCVVHECAQKHASSHRGSCE